MRAELTVAELCRLKRTLESRLHHLIAQEIAVFEVGTGVGVSGISVNIVALTRLGVEEPSGTVESVSASLFLEL